jgi:uncharacterized SAM-binding protein YcdF (DUF218 family)
VNGSSTIDGAGAVAAPRTRRRALRVAAVVVVVVIAAVVAAPPLLRGFGRWLVVSDPLAPADFIYVHAGHLPVRALEGADLYNEGLAPEVWLAETVPTEERAALEAVGVEVPPEWHWSRQVLLQRGVPADAIRLLPVEVANTRDEIVAVVDELRRAGKSKVILVTSRQHTRRVRTLWRSAGARGLEAMVRPSRHDPFDPDRWWTNTDDGEAVLHELIGIADAWLDLGLRPERGSVAGESGAVAAP